MSLSDCRFQGPTLEPDQGLGIIEWLVVGHLLVGLVGDTELKLTMFHCWCGCSELWPQNHGACFGSSLPNLVADTVKLKKVPYRAWLACGAPEAADAGRPSVLCLGSSDAKTGIWEKFGKANKEEYCLALKKFWETVQHLRRRRQFSAKTDHSRDGELLTLTGDIVGRWKQYFEDFLNPADMPFMEGTVAEDSEVDRSSSVVRHQWCMWSTLSTLGV